MYKISIDEIIDYSYCPMLYVLKYKTPEYKNKAIKLLDKYNDDIHKVIYRALNEMQDNKSIGLREIKTYWGKEWIKDKRKSHLVFGETYITKDTYNIRRRKGLDILFNFYNKFKEEKFIPLIINQKYNIKINKILTLTNTIELLRQMDNEEIQLITFKTENYTKSSMLNELKITADYYIAKNIFPDKKIVHYVYNLDKNIMYENKITNKKIEFFKYNIINIFKAIHNKLYYLNSGTHCYNCIYKNVCSGRMNQIINKIDKKEV